MDKWFDAAAEGEVGQSKSSTVRVRRRLAALSKPAPHGDP